MALICLSERLHWSRLADRIISMPLPNIVGTTIVGTCKLVTAADQNDLSCLYPNSMGICREIFGISHVCTTIWCPLFIIFLVFTPGEHIFVKKGLTWLLFWWEERGDQLVSQYVWVLCTMSFLPLLLLFFECCCLSSLLVARPLFLCTMLLFFTLCCWADNLLHSSAVGPCLLCTMSFFLCSMLLFLCSVAGRLFFALSRCFFALSRRLLSHMLQVISLRVSWLEYLGSWGLEDPHSLACLDTGSDKLENTWDLGTLQSTITAYDSPKDKA